MENHIEPNKNRPDPFGRLMSDDGSQDKFRGMSDVFNITSPVGPNDENTPDDVARVEILMDHVGELDLKQTEGPTGFYGERLRQAIMAFQKRASLPTTARITPTGTTMVAVKRAMDVEHPGANTQAGGMVQEAASLLAETGGITPARD